MAKYGKKNKVKEGLENYSICLLGESGIGKTTTIFETCEKLFGSDGYMIFNAGKEQGIDCLQGASYEDIENWKKFEAVIADIIKNKATDYPDLKVIVFDTLDQIIEITEPEVIRKWNSENLGKKDFVPAKTLNAACGGFGRGEDKVIETILNKVWELQKVGVRVWYTGHVKVRDIVDPITNSTYTTLTTNMMQKYFNGFKTKMHVVGMACIDRKIETEGTGRKNIATKKEITINKVKEEYRKIVFRDDNYSVDSKSRFSGIVDSIQMSSDAFIKALEDAITESSVSKFGDCKPPVNKPKKEVSLKPDFEKEIAEDDDLLEDEVADKIEDDTAPFDVTEESTYPEDLIGATRELFKNCKTAELKAEVRETVKTYGKFTDVPRDVLEELYDKLSA